MNKVVAAINMTLDGYCDHTSMIPDEEIHDHYSELLRSGATILFGRITYQLMEYWRTVLENPSGDKSMDEFAAVIDRIPKVVFSRTLQDIDWRTARLASRSLEEELMHLRENAGGDILIGSRSLILSLLNLNLIDELQLCVQPIIAGKGLSLFENMKDRIGLRLVKTKTFVASGCMTLYYEPKKTAC